MGPSYTLHVSGCKIISGGFAAVGVLPLVHVCALARVVSGTQSTCFITFGFRAFTIAGCASQRAGLHVLGKFQPSHALCSKLSIAPHDTVESSAVRLPFQYRTSSPTTRAQALGLSIACLSRCPRALHGEPMTSFEEKNRDTNLNRVWKREYVKWAEWATSVGMSLDQLSGRSILSLHATGSDTRGAKDCYWLETRLLLLVLTAYTRHRQSSTDKQKCRDLLSLLVQFCTTSSCTAPDLITVEHKVLCFHELDDEGYCLHVREHMEGQWVHSIDRSIRWIECLSSLFDRRACKSCAAQLHHALQTCAVVISEQRHAWGGRPEQAQDLKGPTGKRRKVELTRLRAKMDDGSLGLSTMRQLWSRDIVSMLQLGAEVFKCARTLASTFDGGRCGKPARDFNFHWLLDVNTQSCILLPPLVHCSTN
eukprot:6338532-Amphidinium_carterae.2